MRGFFKFCLPLAIIPFLLIACSGGDGGEGGDAISSLLVADAGPDLIASRNSPVQLDGSASSDSDALTFSWIQRAGDDVTGGEGALIGIMPSFNAPPDVQTLEFDLVVNDGGANSNPDRVVIHVLEDAGHALFVDAASGSDSSGDGSMDSPYATIRHALDQVGSTGADLYLRSAIGIIYDEEAGGTLSLPPATSLYGGYGADWRRDVTLLRAEVQTGSAGIQYPDVTADIWVSGLAINAAGSGSGGENVWGLRAIGNGNARMVVEWNHIVAGDVGPGTAISAGSSHGVHLSSLAGAVLASNTILTGSGGDGSDSNSGGPGARGDDGAAGNQTGGRRAPGGSGPGAAGGSGGERGGGQGGIGGDGAAGDNASRPQGGSTLGGAGGTGGNIGNNGFNGNLGGPGLPGSGGPGAGQNSAAAFAVSHGTEGGRGGAGSGGGGGGGGDANPDGVIGGGGGGGGAGGSGGFGGAGGRGAGASVGVWLHAVPDAEVHANAITVASGGNAGRGGSGGLGGLGGAGGGFGFGDDISDGRGADGGFGGRGGTGGTGGAGGGGGGGPAFGIFVAAGLAPLIDGNIIEGGTGGAGGAGANGGDGGASYGVFDSNVSDGLSPILEGNTFTVGSGGPGGARLGTDGSIGAAGIAAETNW